MQHSFNSSLSLSFNVTEISSVGLAFAVCKMYFSFLTLCFLAFRTPELFHSYALTASQPDRRTDVVVPGLTGHTIYGFHFQMFIIQSTMKLPMYFQKRLYESFYFMATFPFLFGIFAQKI
jgi:hypothetical protein